MAFAGLSEIQGLSFLENLNFSKFYTGVGNLVLIIIIAALMGGIFFIVTWWAKNKNLYKEKIYFFEEVNGELIPTEDCMAAELIIPHTDIKIFYIKSKDLYMPRGTRKMGKSAYWYAIRNNREIVNFTIKNINKDLLEAGLDYDHTDMRYAFDNLKEIIKRNYKDKNIKWWQEYKELISIVIFVFVFTLAFYFLITKMGGLVDDIGSIAEEVGKYIGQASNLNKASGIKAV